MEIYKAYGGKKLNDLGLKSGLPNDQIEKILSFQATSDLMGIVTARYGEILRRWLQQIMKGFATLSSVIDLLNEVEIDMAIIHDPIRLFAFRRT